MEKIHVRFSGTELLHPARRSHSKDRNEIQHIEREREKLAEISLRELEKNCGASSFKFAQSGQDYYTNLFRHGDIRGQEASSLGRNGALVWRHSTKGHTGGRNQVCCEMDVPNADEAVRYARRYPGMRVILLSPQRPEGTPLLSCSPISGSQWSDR
jgi:hypothetical protein